MNAVAIVILLFASNSTSELGSKCAVLYLDSILDLIISPPKRSIDYLRPIKVCVD